MSLQHGTVSIYQHTNPGNATDPAIGFWVCFTPQARQAVPTPIPNATLAQLSASYVNPFATQAAAQTCVNAIAAYYQSQNALVVAPSVNPNDVLVGSPVTI